MGLVHQLGCLQFDPIDICGRNADLVLQARVGGYRKSQLETLLYKERKLIDALDKNMAIYAEQDYPKFARNRLHTMGYHRVSEQIENAAAQIKQFMRTHPVICSQDLQWDENLVWVWGRTASLAAVALEVMLYRGGRRDPSPARHNPLLQSDFRAVSRTGSAGGPVCERCGILRMAHRAQNPGAGLVLEPPSDAWLGIEKMKSPERQAAFALLMKQNRIIPVTVEGVDQPLFTVPEALPWLEKVMRKEPFRKRMEFLGPLDNALWDRRLIEALFDFQYKWEIYTPKVQRQYDSYVLPVLWGDRFVGRIALETKTNEGKLIVKQFWREAKVRDSRALRRTLNRTLERFARFHGCPDLDGRFTE